MKRKNLKAFAHNFTHSFVSYTNWVEEGYVIDDLRDFAHTEYKGPLRINWIPESPPSVEGLSHRVKRSISSFREWLPKHAEKHEVEAAWIQEFYLEMFRLPSHQLRIDSVLIDDRGREYRQSVSF